MSAFAAPDDGSPLWSVMIPVYRPNLMMLRQTLAGLSAAAAGAGTMQAALVQDRSGEDDDPDLSAFLDECRNLGIEVFEPLEERIGIGANWNRCIALSRGAFVHILHQDDRIRPEFYVAHEAAFRAAPDIGASFTQHAFISSDGSVLREGHLRRAEAGVLDDWYEHVVANLAIQCPAIVVRRSVYQRLGGFDVSYKYCLDRAMWQRIAAAYPIWFDPRILAEYRQHDESQTTKLSRSILPWRETLRCINDGLKLVAPSARRATERRARYVLTRLAFNEARFALRRRHFRSAAGTFAGLISIGRPIDYATILAGISPQAPVGRSLAIDLTSPGQRRRRVVLITEFFPVDPGRSVFGVFSRLRCLLEGLERVGEVDIVFFWPVGREASADEQVEWERQVRSVWPISGAVRFVRAGRSRRLLHILSDAVWGLRGALGIFDSRPSMRTSGRATARSMRRVLSQLQPDIILAHRVSAAISLWRIGRPMPPVVVDVDDLEDMKLARAAAMLPKWTDRLMSHAWSRLARRATIKMSQIASRLLVTSELDRSRLEALRTGAPVVVVPNTARSFQVDRQHATAPVALFVGTFAYPPNVEGVTWLLAHVWPAVRRAIPAARLLIAGAGAERLKASSMDGVELLGFVSDLGPLYREARIAVCPIHRGAGTRIKIIEAAMNGRPTVATVVGAEGLAFAQGSEIVLVDEPTQFSEACVDLLSDPARADQIGDAARLRAEAIYDPDVVKKQLATICVDTLRAKDGWTSDRSLRERTATGT